MPKRIQLSRAKGWHMPENTVKVDRTTRWGNPFKIGPNMDRTQAIALYRRWVAGEDLDIPPFALDPKELKGKNLACWCSLDGPCHAEVLLELANEP